MLQLNNRYVYKYVSMFQILGPIDEMMSLRKITSKERIMLYDISVKTHWPTTTL